MTKKRRLFTPAIAAAQRIRKARYRDAGRCANCGGVRDRAPLVICAKCAAAAAKSRRYRDGILRQDAIERRRARARQPWNAVHQVILSIPPPPRGSLAYQMACAPWSSRRTEAA